MKVKGTEWMGGDKPGNRSTREETNALLPGNSSERHWEGSLPLVCLSLLKHSALQSLEVTDLNSSIVK